MQNWIFRMFLLILFLLFFNDFKLLMFYNNIVKNEKKKKKKKKKKKEKDICWKPSSKLTTLSSFACLQPFLLWEKVKISIFLKSLTRIS